LNLAYDLRYATDHFPGIGTHALGLAAALLERPGFESVTFLWDPRARNTRFDLEPLRRHPRARWRELHVSAMSVDTAAATGRVLSGSDVDVYLSPFWLRPEGTDVPCVVTVHDVLPLARPADTSWPRRLAFRWAMGRAATASAVLTVSHFSRGEILRLTPIPAERLHVVPNGVVPTGAEPRRPEGAPDGPFALVVATNRPHKGLETLAEAWRGLGDDAPLALVGAGARSAGRFSLRDLARERAGVHALGQVTPAGLEWLYRNATLVLVPSLYEGFGLPLIEAAARGAAIVASDIPALRESGDGIARFVPAGDAGAWARAVRELAADAGARASMGERAHVRARDYDCARSAARVVTLLADLMVGGRA